MTELKNKVVAGLKWSATFRFLSQIITWVSTIYVMRLLTPADYGLMALSGVFLAFMQGFKDLGIGAALIQRKEIEENLLQKSFGLVLLIGFTLFILGYSFAPAAAHFFEEEQIVWIMRLLSLNFLFLSLTVIPQTLLRRAMDFKTIGLLDCAAALVGCAVTLSLAIMGKGVWALAWGAVVINFSKTILYNVMSHSFIRPQLCLAGMSGVLSYGGKATVNGFVWRVSSSIDVFIIGKILGKDILGFYSVAKHLASLLMDKLSPILQEVAFPAYSSIQSDLERVKRGFLASMGVVAFVCFPIFWGISSTAPGLVLLVLGEKWQMAVMPLQLIALVIPLRMANTLLAPLLTGIGKVEVLIINQINFLVIISLSLLIGVRWELTGVSLAWVAGFPIIFLINASIGMRVIGGSLIDLLTTLVKPLIFSSLMYAVVTIFSVLMDQHLPSFFVLISSIIVGIVVYAGLSFSMAKTQTQRILSFVRKT